MTAVTSGNKLGRLWEGRGRQWYSDKKDNGMIQKLEDLFKKVVKLLQEGLTR